MTGSVTKHLVAMLLPLVLLAGTAALAQDEPAGADEVPREDAVRSPGPDAVAPETLANGDQPPVFGARIFTGAFSAQPFSGFNPDYQITIGDQLRVQLWGAVEFGELLSVDAQGNIFLPQIGPVRVAGVRNDRLTAVVEDRVRQVYRQQVGVYANLESAQPVSVLVSGFVRRPGMYRGLSSDSVLYFLDRAGGIDPARGSFLDIRVQRGGYVRQKVNLYDFLLKGLLPPIPFADGDSVHVGAAGNSVSVEGAVNNAARFEFTGDTIMASQVVGWALPRPEATHFRVRRNNAGETTAEFLPLIALDPVVLKPGDRVTIIPEDRPQTIEYPARRHHRPARAERTLRPCLDTAVSQEREGTPARVAASGAGPPGTRGLGLAIAHRRGSGIAA
jgi:protein involved in polysaccharide export with SLBB domain